MTTKRDHVLSLEARIDKERVTLNRANVIFALEVLREERDTQRRVRRLASAARAFLDKHGA